jgi:DNA repair exonuclease SbcCD ATPase subunit
MQIRRVKLKNFRQFYGEQDVEFPTTGKKNVTLIHAENGFGKTSILNAVLWCLFRQVTPKFERPDDIVNYEAAAEGEKTATVDVEIEFKKNRYLIQRTFFSDREGRDKTQLNAYRLESGNLKVLPAPETFVGSVVPPEMARFFFFDGEAAESFAAARNYKEIGNAIRSILGCSLAETAISDLKDLCKNVDREIGDISGDVRIEDLEVQIAKRTADLETAANAREQLIADITTLKEQHDEIERALREARGAEEIQRQRDDKQAQKKQTETALAECQVEILKWIGQRSIQVISKRLSQVALDFVDEAGLRGRIPSPYNEDFVRGLLGSGTCVCHRPLPAGTPEWAAVAELLKTASNAEVLGRVVRARARSQVLREEASEAPKALSGMRSKLAKLLSQQTQLEQQVAELGKKLEALPVQEIANRERSRRSIAEKIDRERERLGGIKVHIVTLERGKAALVTQLEDLARRNNKTVRLLEKRQLVMRSIDLLRGTLEQYELEARRKIQDDVNAILEVVAHKDFRCRFNDTFSIELILDERATAKSGGENQLLSLAFIASLVKFAAERIDAEDHILKPGTIAPLVLDAPLGQLDPSYQESVAEFLPQLAQQVVLLVSGSQGGERVLQALAPYVGAEYLLIQENKEHRGKKQAMQRAIHGKNRDLILFGQRHTMTRIERLA